MCPVVPALARGPCDRQPACPCFVSVAAAWKFSGNIGKVSGRTHNRCGQSCIKKDRTWARSCLSTRRGEQRVVSDPAGKEPAVDGRGGGGAGLTVSGRYGGPAKKFHGILNPIQG